MAEGIAPAQRTQRERFIKPNDARPPSGRLTRRREQAAVAALLALAHYQRAKMSGESRP